MTKRTGRVFKSISRNARGFASNRDACPPHLPLQESTGCPSVSEERVVSEQPPSVAPPESASAWKPRAQSPQGDPSPMTEQHSGPGPGRSHSA